MSHNYIDRSFNLVFLINLFGYTNIARIFYQSSQICVTHIKEDNYLRMEGVDVNISLKTPN